MTMVDEKFLTDALAELAGGFEVPVGGVEEIVERAAASESTRRANTAHPGTAHPEVGGRAARIVRNHRPAVVGVAAAALVVVALAAVATPTFLGSKTTALQAGPMRSIGGQHAAPALPSIGAASGGVTYGPAGSQAPSFGSYSPGQQNSQNLAAPGTGDSAAGSSVPPLPSGAVGSNQAIQKTGSVSLTVPHGTFGSVINRLTALASGTGGFVSNTQTNQDTGTPSGTITVEVPVNDFETVLDQVRSLGKVDSVSTKADNVTGQVVDLQSRIQALQDSLSQYEKILSQATSIPDILSVQNEIDSLQSQIEQLQGQQNLLNASTSFSTLSVAVTEAPTRGHHAPPPPAPATGIGKAWHDAVHGFTAGFDGLVSITGPLLFALICLGVLIVLGRLLWRASRRWLL